MMQLQKAIIGKDGVVATIYERDNGGEVVFFQEKNIDIEYGLEIIDTKGNKHWDEELMEMVKWLLFPQRRVDLLEGGLNEKQKA